MKARVEILMAAPAEFTQSDEPAVATEAVATQVAPGSTDRHYVTAVSGSYGAAAIGLLTIEQGTGPTVIYRRHVHNAADLVFDRPLEIPRGAQVTARLARSCRDLRCREPCGFHRRAYDGLNGGGHVRFDRICLRKRALCTSRKTRR